MRRTDNTHNAAQSFSSVWLNGWVLIYKLSGCGFESSCSHLLMACPFDSEDP